MNDEISIEMLHITPWFMYYLFPFHYASQSCAFQVIRFSCFYISFQSFKNYERFYKQHSRLPHTATQHEIYHSRLYLVFKENMCQWQLFHPWQTDNTYFAWGRLWKRVLSCVICCFFIDWFFVCKQSNNNELFRVLRQPLLHESSIKHLRTITNLVANVHACRLSYKSDNVHVPFQRWV